MNIYRNESRFGIYQLAIVLLLLRGMGDLFWVPILLKEEEILYRIIIIISSFLFINKILIFI